MSDLILGAGILGFGLFGISVFVVWKLWRESSWRKGGRDFSDWAILAIFFAIPFAVLFPIFPGIWIAISQCDSRGGERVHQYVRTDGYALAWGRSKPYEYDFGRLALDLIERKIAYVEILETTHNQIISELRYAQSGAGRARPRGNGSSAAPGQRFFVSEARSTNCIDHKLAPHVLQQYRSVQAHFGLPETLCIAAEAIEESSSKYSVVFEVEEELLPAPISWKVLRLRRVSDGRTMAEDRGFSYLPYGSGLLSALLGGLDGHSLRGFSCEMNSAEGGLFVQGMHAAREQYQSDLRIRASPELRKFYSI